MERTIPKLGRVIAQRFDCHEITVEMIDPKTGYGVIGVYDRVDWDPAPVKGYIPKMGRVVARSKNGHQVSTVWAARNGLARHLPLRAGHLGASAAQALRSRSTRSSVGLRSLCPAARAEHIRTHPMAKKKIDPQGPADDGKLQPQADGCGGG